jgi:hypothetical protein
MTKETPIEIIPLEELNIEAFQQAVQSLGKSIHRLVNKPTPPPTEERLKQRTSNE